VWSGRKRKPGIAEPDSSAAGLDHTVDYGKRAALPPNLIVLSRQVLYTSGAYVLSPVLTLSMSLQTTNAASGLTGHRLVARRTRRYFESLRWLIASVFRFKPLTASLIVGLIAVGRSLQAAAFTAIVWYFLAIEENAPITYFGQTIEPRTSEAMTGAVLGVTALLVIASAIIFVSMRMAFYLSMGFAERVIKRILTEDGCFPAYPTLEKSGLISAQAHMVLKTKIHLFRPVNVLLMLPRSLLLAFPAIVGMIWIAGEVVAVVAVLAIPAVAFNYLISRSVVVSQRERKIAQRAYRGDEKEAIGKLGNEANARKGRAGIADALLAGKNNRTAVRAFSIRILSPSRSELVANVLASVAVASIGVYLGGKAINGEMPLALVVAFFVLLRLAVSGLTSIGISLTTYARFYEVVRAAFEYLTSRGADGEPFAGRPALHVPNPQTDADPGGNGNSGSGNRGNGRDVPLERGRPVAVISPARINRYTQYFFTAALTQKLRLLAQRRFNAQALRCTAGLIEPEIRAALALPPLGPDLLTGKAATAPLSDLAPGADTIDRAARRPNGLKRDDQARIALLSACLSSADLIVVEPELLAALPKAERARWIAALSDRYIAIAYPHESFSGCIAGETHAIVMDYERAIAIARAGSAAKTLKSLADAIKPPKAAEADDDDLEA